MNRRNMLQLGLGLLAGAPILTVSGAPATAAGAPQTPRCHKIGLIGGIGPESTIPYYRSIVYGVQKRLGLPYFPPMTVESLNVFQVVHLAQQKDLSPLVQYVGAGISNLVAAKVEAVAMTGNTPHVVLDELQKDCPVPIISIVQTACDAAVKKGCKRLALLGTISTMKADFFHAPFRKAGIEIVTPEGKDKERVHAIIESELELGVVREPSIQEVNAIAGKILAEKRADAVVLGCTELPMLYRDKPAPFACLDTMAIHIEALVDFITRGA